MPSYLLSEWQAYYQMEPFGEERGDLRAAIIACVIANANRGKGSKAYEVKDFMPKFEKEEMSLQDTIAFASQITAALGGEVRSNG